MYVVHDLAGRYWNGHAFSSYYTHTAKRFLSFVDANIKAKELKAVVDTTSSNTVQPVMRMYELFAENHSSGEKTNLTRNPVTQDECYSMRSKLTAYSSRTLLVSEAEYKVVFVEDLEGIALTWVVAVLSGKKVDLGLSNGDKAIYLNENGVVRVYNPVEDPLEFHLLTCKHNVDIYDDPVMPQAVIVPDPRNPYYFYRMSGKKKEIAALKCVVRSRAGNDRVSIPKWLVG